MSGEKLGYRRRIVSEPPDMAGADIIRLAALPFVCALLARAALLIGR